MKTDKTFSELLVRIEKLERAVFGREKVTAIKRKDFAGATGGLRFLISEGFFNHKRSFSEVESELRKQNYHYSKQAIQTPLNRLSRAGSVLVGFREKGKKVYAKRK
ncbi:MAG: hypothetical protein V1746_01305 [bacterium]